MPAVHSMSLRSLPDPRRTWSVSASCWTCYSPHSRGGDDGEHSRWHEIGTGDDNPERYVDILLLSRRREGVVSQHIITSRRSSRFDVEDYDTYQVGTDTMSTSFQTTKEDEKRNLMVREEAVWCDILGALTLLLTHQQLRQHRKKGWQV